MYLTKTIPIELYDTKVRFIVTSNIVKTHNRINEYHKTDVKWKRYEAPAGCCILVSMSTYYVLISSDYLTHNTISHELFHCTCNIASDRGVHEEESRAWLHGIISQEVHDFLKSKNILL